MPEILRYFGHRHAAFSHVHRSAVTKDVRRAPRNAGAFCRPCESPLDGVDRSAAVLDYVIGQCRSACRLEWFSGAIMQWNRSAAFGAAFAVSELDFPSCEVDSIPG